MATCKTWKIEGALANKYRGCGAAIAKISLRFEGERRFLDKLQDFNYLLPAADDIGEMSEDAGEIKHYENERGERVTFDQCDQNTFAFVIVNLSCYEACLA